jgi:hypothetical protein
MAFPREILVAGIGIADALTAGVQCLVSYEEFISADGNGDEDYEDPVSIACVVDQTRKHKTTSTGRIDVVVATLTFPRGDLNIGPKDKITLPDGTTGPLIIDAPDAVVDPVTGRGFIQTVMIGEVATQTGA